MQVEARFRRRPSVDEKIPELHKRVLEKLLSIPGLGKGAATAEALILEFGEDEGGGANLTPILAPGVKGCVSYVSRFYAGAGDVARNDDYLILAADTELVSFSLLCREIFPAVIEVFGPYRAAVVSDLNQDLDDFDAIIDEAERTGRDVDGRDTVYRLRPLNFFDDEMCKRAFGHPADDLVVLAKRFFSGARLFHGGALLPLSDEPLLSHRLFTLDMDFRQSLNMPPKAFVDP